METKKHSPTPWIADIPYIHDVKGDQIAVSYGYYSGGGRLLQQANTARIVACVNACEGVSNEQLTGMRVAELVAQRDEMLAALKILLSVVNVRIDDPRIKQFDEARAAIAKAEEGVRSHD